MATIVEPAPAKLNLALHVRARRADGYHDLETLFAFAGHGDTVTVSGADTPHFAITGPFAPALAGDEGSDNLVLRAARSFGDVFGIARHYRITLDKHLPVASGIGGGSADAAATLRALCRLNDVAIDDARLMTVARALGADVPACLLGKAMVGTGKGDDLVAIAGVGGLPALLVNPGIAVSTGAVFARWDGIDRGAIAVQGTMLERALAGRNDLEPPARLLAPVIGDVVALLGRQAGVRLARMSGSGATCFALFGDAAARDAADRVVAAHAPGWWRLATTVA